MGCSGLAHPQAGIELLQILSHSLQTCLHTENQNITFIDMYKLVDAKSVISNCHKQVLSTSITDLLAISLMSTNFCQCQYYTFLYHYHQQTFVDTNEIANKSVIDINKLVHTNTVFINWHR